MKQLFREILFLGQPQDVESLSLYIQSLHVTEWKDLHEAIETLHYFRKHYQSDKVPATETNRAKVARLDADWTMQILAMIGV